MIFPAVKAAAEVGRFATTGTFELIAPVLTHVVEGAHHAVFCARDQNRLPKIIEHEKVTRLGDITGSTCQEPRFGPDVVIFQFQKGGVGVAIHGNAFRSKLWLWRLGCRCELAIRVFAHSEDPVFRRFQSSNPPAAGSTRRDESRFRWRL